MAALIWSHLLNTYSFDHLVTDKARPEHKQDYDIVKAPHGINQPEMS